MTLSEDHIKSIPLWQAILPVLILTILLGGSVYLFGDGSSSGPNQIGLLLAAAIVVIIGILRGQKWEDLERSIVEGISHAMKACLILLAVGALVGSWMLAGTAPSLIYVGLNILDSAWIYPASMVALRDRLPGDRQQLDDSGDNWFVADRRCASVGFSRWKLRRSCYLRKAPTLAIRCPRFPIRPTWPLGLLVLTYSPTSSICSGPRHRHLLVAIILFRPGTGA